jgi:uncharacterized repeat protein (TIGR03803 family)
MSVFRCENYRQTRENKVKSRTGALTLAALAVASFMSASAVPSHAQLPKPTPLYGFQQEPTDVIEPSGPLAQGRDGNLYGTGVNRGANTRGGVFRITPSGRETLLVSFPNSFTEGSCLGLTLGMDGNFYGTCFGGGAHNFGLFYRVTPAGVLTDLYDFTVNGVGIQGAPVLGADGNFYGSTSAGFYRITPAGVYKNLFTLNGSIGDSLPSVLNAGSDGNFYGTIATASGVGNQGGVFRLTSAGAFNLIYGFDSSSPVGSGPSLGVTMGSDGKLYGTTGAGGANSNGTIYTMTTAGGAATALHNINNITEGANGTGGNGEDSENLLFQASNGNFYGANFGGGSGNQGGLYELTSKDVFSGFLFLPATNTTIGTNPGGPLMQHTNGTIFGINDSNGPNEADGVFFSLNIGASPFIRLVMPVYTGTEATQVGILGQGFKSTSVVKFGGTIATTKTLSGTTFILATVPAGALTGKVTVTTGSATLSTLAVFKVTPVAASFTPASGVVGTTVTITGTGLKQATKVTFNKIAAATFTVKSDTQITAMVPAGATTGKIVVTTTGGTATSAKAFTVN